MKELNVVMLQRHILMQRHQLIFTNVFFRPMRWLTKTLYVSAAVPAPLLHRKPPGCLTASPPSMCLVLRLSATVGWYFFRRCFPARLQLGVGRSLPCAGVARGEHSCFSALITSGEGEGGCTSCNRHTANDKERQFSSCAACVVFFFFF